MEFNPQTLKGGILETRNIIAALAALAQESRLAVFRLLVRAGPQGMAASKIGEQLGIPPSSLSFHLKELTHAALTVARQEGRFIIYTANFQTMNSVMTFLTDSCCDGEPCALPVLACNADTGADTGNRQK